MAARKLRFWFGSALKLAVFDFGLKTFTALCISDVHIHIVQQLYIVRWHEDRLHCLHVQWGLASTR